MERNAARDERRRDFHEIGVRRLDERDVDAVQQGVRLLFGNDAEAVADGLLDVDPLVEKAGRSARTVIDERDDLEVVRKALQGLELAAGVLVGHAVEERLQPSFHWPFAAK